MSKNYYDKKEPPEKKKPFLVVLQSDWKKIAIVFYRSF